MQTKGSDPEILNIEVLRSRVRDGKTYFLITGYGVEDEWVRRGDGGALVREDGVEVARLVPGAAAYRTKLSGCLQTALPGAEASAAGALAVRYAADDCRDVGFTEEVYGPEIGLVRRAVTTFAGEKVFELVSAHVDGASVVGMSGEIVLDSRFSRGSTGWLPGFADYDRRSQDLRMVADVRALPDEVDGNRTGFYLQSMNRSDDLFMFLKKEVTEADGLAPDSSYLVSFDIRFASNAPTGGVGVGGSPGDGVYLKAGASADEPLALLGAGSPEIQMSVDKGAQANGGRDAGVVGTIANGSPCESLDWRYKRVRKAYGLPHPVRTDSRGALWLLVGTDSAYEGLTGLYIESITVRINPAVEAAGR